MKHLIENQNWNLLSIWNIVSYIRAKWNVQRNETLECMFQLHLLQNNIYVFRWVRYEDILSIIIKVTQQYVHLLLNNFSLVHI